MYSVAYSSHVSRGSCIWTFLEHVICKSYISCGFLRRENVQSLWKWNLKQHVFTSFSVLHGQGNVTLQLETQLHNNNNNNNNNNRLCQQFDETIDHIISSCPILAREQYLQRNDRVCAKLYFNIYKERGVKLDNEHWYKHVPKWVGTVHDGVSAYCRINKCKPTEASLIINRTS